MGIIHQRKEITIKNVTFREKILKKCYEMSRNATKMIRRNQVEEKENKCE